MNAASFLENSFETHKVVHNGEYDPQILESVAKFDNRCYKNRDKRWD